MNGSHTMEVAAETGIYFNFFRLSQLSRLHEYFLYPKYVTLGSSGWTAPVKYVAHSFYKK